MRTSPDGPVLADTAIDVDGARAERAEATAPTDPEQLGPGTMVDHFEVRRLLASGGMGQVYVARDTKLGRRVALKLVLRSLMRSERAKRAFEAEARTIARFSHPNIVAIHDVGEYEGTPYVALEYVEGETLRDRLDRRGVSRAEALRIALAITDALREAHRHGVLHRDLKPENVVIGIDGRVRVLDFGLAKNVGTPTAEPNAPPAERSDGGTDGLKGTPQYMAPEQWRAEASSSATDVWAIGELLFELISHQTPFAAESLVALYAIVSGPDPAPRLDALVEVSARLADLVAGCLAKDPAERPNTETIRDTLEALLANRPARDDESASPFRGLFPFSERHAGLFFGRDREVDAFVERLRQRPVLPVVGPSGAGKTSFVRAGVIPRLHEQARWLVLSIRPGLDPMGAIVNRLARSGQRSTLDEPERSSIRPSSFSTPTAKQLRANPGQLGLTLRQLAEEQGASVLLYVDATEELFTGAADGETQRCFLEAICGAADEPDEPVRVVFSVRDDFLGALASSASARDALRDVTVLRRPPPEALVEILTRPAHAVGYTFEDDELPAQIAAAVAEENAALPLLSFAADRLWDLRDPNEKLLLRSAYERIGGVEGALATHADGVLGGLSGEETAIARAALLRLVSADGTRVMRDQDEILESLPSGANEVLGRLIGARLIAVHKPREGSDRGPRVELAHESLIRGWPTLAGWLEASRDELAFRAGVEEAARRWERRGQPIGLLWQGDELLDALRLRARSATPLAKSAAQFLAAAEQRHFRGVRRRRAVILGALVALTVVAVVLGVLSRQLAQEKQRAERQRTETLLEDARSSFEGGRLREARAKLRVAFEDHDSTAARALLWRLDRQPTTWRLDLSLPVRSVVYSPDGSQVAAGGDSGSLQLIDAESGAVRVLRGHADQVAAVHYSDDALRLASGDLSGRVLVWEGDPPRPTTEITQPSGVSDLELVPGGAALLSAGRDGDVRLWDLPSGRLVRVVHHGAPVRAIDVSPDGRTVAIGDAEGVASIAAIDGSGARRLWTSSEMVHSVRISHDGQTLAVGGPSGSIVLLRVRDGTVARVLEGHGDHVGDLQFSPDDAILGSASFDGEVRLWDRATGALVGRYREHDSLVYSLAFSPDGQSIVSASYDNTLRRWSPSAAARVEPAGGHADRVTGVTFTPDGQSLVSCGTDGTVRVWALADGSQRHVLRGHGAEVWGVAVSPDGRWISSGGSDRSVRLWDAQLGVLQRVLGGHVGDVDDVEFSPDGAVVASSGADRTLRIWDLGEGGGARILRGHEGAIYRIAFDADGARIASASSDATVGLWRTDTGDRIATLDAADRVRDVRFTSDGRVISASDDGRVMVHTSEGGASATMTHRERVQSVDAQPDGDLVASGSMDGVLRIWRSSGERVREVRGHRGRIWMARFSQDGQRIVTGGGDSTVRVWDVSDGRPLWHAAALLAEPPRLVTRRGLLRLDSDGTTELTTQPTGLPETLDHALRENTRTASTRGDTMCLWTFDDAVEVWAVSEGARLLRLEPSGLRAVRALSDGCAMLSDAGLERTRGARVASVPLPGDPVALGHGPQLLVATAQEVLAIGPDDSVGARAPTDIGVTALARAEDGAFLVGYAEGSVQRIAPGEARGESMERHPAASPTRIALAPRETILVGYSDGTLVLWDLATGSRLGRSRLHGPVAHITRDGAQFVVASELGDTIVWNLDAFTEERCVLLQRMWAHTPLSWADGRLQRVEIPTEHACAR